VKRAVFGWLAIVLLAVPAAAWAQGDSGGVVELESRVFELGRQLRCPTCTSESVGDSSSAISIEMRNEIRDQIALGKSDDEILAFFQERYGDWVLLEPPREGIHLFVWILPVVGVVAGAAGLALLMTRWLAKARAPLDDVNDEDLARVQAAMKSGPDA